MFKKLRAKKWWKRFLNTASRKERRKILRQARKLQTRKKYKVWRGMDIEAGGLLLGKVYMRHNRAVYDRDELVFVNLRNANMIPFAYILNYIKHYLLLPFRKTKHGNKINLRDFMTLEYRLPGRIYTVIKVLLFHYSDLKAGRKVIGSWHSHPIGIQEPSEQDEKTAAEHKKRLGIEHYFLGIEKNGNVEIFRY